MSETTPYFEDNTRKGATRGEAIFGDKQAQFEPTTVGEQEMAAVEQEEAKHDITINHMGELAAQQAISLVEFSNQHPDVDQDRLDAMYKARVRR